MYALYYLKEGEKGRMYCRWETDQSPDKMIREGSVYLFCVPPLFYPVASY
jgi:hypothetical protein